MRNFAFEEGEFVFWKRGRNNHSIGRVSYTKEDGNLVEDLLGELDLGEDGELC